MESRLRLHLKKIGVRFSASLSKAPLELSSHTFHEQAQYHIYIHKKRESRLRLPFKKIGGGLLFHELAQYHRRYEA